MAIRVLFLCTGNSARSIIAEALLRRRGGDRFAAFSAGTRPTGVNPLAVEALAAAGVPAGMPRSKDLTEFAGQSFDYLITLCDSAAAECPVFAGAAQRLHWSLPDPAAIEDAAARRAAFRSTVTSLERHLAAFLPQALAATDAGTDAMGRP